MCGENLEKLESVAKYVGSPPRVRGKRNKWNNFSLYTRITPACAGKTLFGLQRPRLGEDHPRVCGENRDRWGGLHEIAGSPPRVRGKLSPETQMNDPQRITPACAGKTSLELLQAFLTEDHPRVCGENKLIYKQQA